MLFTFIPNPSSFSPSSDDGFFALPTCYQGNSCISSEIMKHIDKFQGLFPWYNNIKNWNACIRYTEGRQINTGNTEQNIL